KQALLQDQQLARSQDVQLVRTLAIQAHNGWTMKRTEEHEKAVANLTAAQVNAAAKKYIDPAAMSIFKAGDFKKAGITQERRRSCRRPGEDRSWTGPTGGTGPRPVVIRTAAPPSDP